MSKRVCVRNPGIFCCTCGEYTLQRRREKEKQKKHRRLSGKRLIFYTLASSLVIRAKISIRFASAFSKIT